MILAEFLYMKHPLLLFLIPVLMLMACRYDVAEEIPPAEDPNISKIIFLGHTYEWQIPAVIVDKRLRRLDFDQFDQIWLGGDLCGDTSGERTTLMHVDSMFRLGDPSTFWAIGNHDIVDGGNVDWIREFTGRDLHYTSTADGMTMMVINTLYDSADCVSREAQFQMIKQVCDTISESAYLVLLMHHVVWGDVESKMNAGSVANAGAWHWRARCNPFTNFTPLVYPMLVEVQNRGVKVIVISGDAGMKPVKSYEYITQDGIWFLACGLNNSQERDLEKRKLLPPDKVLYMEYDKKIRHLSWEFRALDFMIENE